MNKTYAQGVDASDLACGVACKRCGISLNNHTLPLGTPVYDQTADHELQYWKTNCGKCGAPVEVFND
jgi:hypothetical protein